MDSWEPSGRYKLIGSAVGAAILVVMGGVGFVQYGSERTLPTLTATATASTDRELLQQILAKLTSLEMLAVENRHRIEALERPGGTVPMARETRERLEAVDRTLAEMQRQMSVNTNRLDLLIDRRGRP